MDPLDSDKAPLTCGRDLINDKNGSNGTVKRGNKLKPPSKIAISTIKSETKARPATSTKQSNATGYKYTHSPRPSANDRLSQHRMSHSSINSQRPTSPPAPSQRLFPTPRTTPRQTLIGSGPTASPIKSPVAQLRQNYDTLKLKYDANEKRIAEQQAELELLKKQLVQACPPLTPPPSLLNKPTRLKSNMDLEQALLKKDKAIERMEQDLAEMQRKLEATNQNTIIPSSPVKPSVDGTRDNLIEKDQEPTSALEKSSDQVEKLKLENEEVLSQLITKEKKLETLPSQTTSSNAMSYTHTPSDAALLELQIQLDKQKHHYEAILHQHELTILEKEKLLNEQTQLVITLKKTHDDNLQRRQAEQSSKLLKLRQRHKQEMIKLQQKMDAEKAEKQSPNDQCRQEYFENELEKIVHAFEQAEHDHKSQYLIHNTLPSDLATLDKDRLRTIGASQGHTSTRYLPTQAVSWPDPQPLSILRKTFGPYSRQTTLVPILDSSDPNKVQIYLSSVSGNPIIKKNQDHIQQLFRSQQITFESVDVAASEMVLQYMRRSNGSTKELPQLFVGGEFRGLYADVVRHVDEGTLDVLLTPRHTMDALSSSSSSSSASSTSSLPSFTKTLTDEDEALLKDLEREFGQGNIDLAQLDHL